MVLPFSSTLAPGRVYASSASTEALLDDFLLLTGSAVGLLLRSSSWSAAFLRSNSMNENTPVPRNLSSWPKP